MKKLKKIPAFKTEKEESLFWETHDTTDYIDWSKAKRASFPDLKPSVATISIRLPADLLNDLKSIAHKKDVPYQSLMKMYLAEKIKDEFHK